MNDYIKVAVYTRNEELIEIAIAELAEIGAESFDDFKEGANAYIKIDLFDKEAVAEIFANEPLNNVNYLIEEIKNENWNSVWESEFKPVTVNNTCTVYASFHKNLPPTRYMIEINPKMTFGTGHHETTHLCIEALLNTNVKGKNVLDMGCGTAVLAVLASMMGAETVTAIDNDPQAAENSAENVVVNKTSNVAVFAGDAALINGKSFDVIVANINRNVLLTDMAQYASCMKTGGQLILSGFYKEDVQLLLAEAEINGLKQTDIIFRNGWACLQTIKQ